MAQPKKIIDLFKETKLWKHLLKKTDDQSIKLGNVNFMVEFALPLLDRINDTFPTYTLHNGQHQLNILNIMGDLLGERLEELSDLETLILLLSAFYHDIGMVFLEEERKNLTAEPDFEIFLKENPSAKLAMANSNDLSIEITEKYCRWSHAKRVWIFLDRIKDGLDWKKTNIKKELGEICLSHNEKIEYLKQEQFQTNFWDAADLRFCAILLRLADILDFDNTRSPQSVFEYLQLDKPKNERDRVSYEEWQKHLASEGFDFSKWQKNIPYEIIFKAIPTHPAVEGDIREFLDTIEVEIQNCSALIDFCSKKWNNFKLPYKINKDNIKSRGYKYGNYKFSLNQQQILDLLMGENLYNDPYMFIRELLQNAIDTSRDREFHEHSNGDKGFKTKPIEVTSWIDNEGYRWIRMDDFGMGMTEEIINKFLLKVGNSYYNSDEFKVRKLGYKKSDGVDFTPISRFGIGILSCFIIGDQVEINTRSIKSIDGILPIRISLKGLHNFYVLQMHPETPSAMPKEHIDERTYRKEVGTSIAVRIDPKKEIADFNLKQTLEGLIFDCPVSIIYDAEEIGVKTKQLVNQNIHKYFDYEVTEEIEKQIEEFLGKKLSLKPKIEIVPLDLTKNSASKNLKGQILLIDVISEFGKVREHTYPVMSITLIQDFNEGVRIGINCVKEQREGDKVTYPNLLIELNDLEEVIKLVYQPFKDFKRRNLIVSHNGIILPHELNREIIYNKALILKDSVFNQHSSYEHKNTLMFGYISLTDELYPNLSVSRNTVIAFPWFVYSQISLAFLRALNNSGAQNKNWNHLGILNVAIQEESITVKEISEDELIKDDTKWPIEKIIYDKNILELNVGNTFVAYFFKQGDYFTNLLVMSLIQIRFNVKLNKDGVHNFNYSLESKSEKTFNQTTLDFPPFFFVDSYEENKLRTEMNDLNISHRFSQWFLKNSLRLKYKYPGMFESIVNRLKIIAYGRYAMYAHQTTEDVANSFNEMLKRLITIEHGGELAPPKSIFLKKEDLE